MNRVKIVKGETIKAGDFLYWYTNENGEIVVRKKVSGEWSNCQAQEDLEGPEVFLNSETGSVFNRLRSHFLGEEKICKTCLFWCSLFGCGNWRISDVVGNDENTCVKTPANFGCIWWESQKPHLPKCYDERILADAMLKIISDDFNKHGPIYSSIAKAPLMKMWDINTSDSVGGHND